MIYSFKATGDYAPTFISQNIKDLLGYDREEYLDSPDFWQSRVHPDDSPRILERYVAPVRGRAPQQRVPLPQEGRQLLLGQRRVAADARRGRRSGRGGRAPGATSPRASSSARLWSPRRTASCICCPAAPAVIYSYKATGDFAPTFVSENIQDWLGYEPQEYLEHPDFWRRCVHPDDLAGVEAQSVQLFKKGRHTVEYRFLKKDGSYCWVNDEQHLIRDKDGQPVEVVGSWSDVTARKEAEIAFRRSEQRLTDAIEFDLGGLLALRRGGSADRLQQRLRRAPLSRAWARPRRERPTRRSSAPRRNAALVEDAKGRVEEWVAERLRSAPTTGRAACAAPRRRPLDPDQRAQDDGGRHRRRLHQHYRDQAGRGGASAKPSARRTWRTSS